MSSINFDNAYYLLIALPLIVLFTIPFALAIRKDNVNGHNITSQVLHVVIALLVGFAAAGTNYTTVLTETDVYVVADVSYSAHRNLDTIDNYIKSLKLPNNAKLGVVTFGKDAELLYGLGSPSGVGSVKDFTVDDSETNIAEALDYAGTLFEPDVIKRIVLITDGKQTDEQDSYAIRRAVTNLQMQNVTVDAIFIDDALTDNTPEVQISSVDFTGSTFLNHTEYANVAIQTNRDMRNARITITSTDYTHSQLEDLTTGVTTVPLKLPTGTAGTFDYEITVEPDDPGEDTSGYNNSYSFTQIVSGEVNVLFVTDEWDDVVAAANKYSAGATVDIYENDSAREVTLSQKEQYISTLPSNVTVHIRSGDVAPEIPFSVEELCNYDEIVLSDVDITGFKNYTAFVENTDIVVSMFGKSLVTMGDLHIQSKESAELKQLEDMLPVRYGNSDEDPKLFTLVIDSSRSMAGYNHLTVAKEAATRLIGLLQDTDEVCIITFNGDARMVQMPTKLANRDAVLEKINSLEVVQGTFIGAGLRMAFESINDLVYSDKQLMLITDGLSFTDEEDDPATIVQDMYENGIVTSVLDVGRPGGSSSDTDDPTAMAAKQLLQTLADEEHGHGNYYYSDNAENLGDVLFGEMADRMGESIIEKKTAVNIVRSTDGVFTGMFEDAEGNPLPQEIPDVDGYLYTYSKASAISVLTVDHEKGNLITPKPLYAYWNYGNGKVASFTSKLCGEWISEWETEQLDKKFFANVKTELTPSERMSYPFNFVVSQDGNAVHVEIVPPVAHPNATASVEIVFPDGTSTRSNLTFDSSSYYTDFMTSGTGKYTINILYRYNKKDYSATRIMTLAYPAEYNAFETFDSAILHKAIDNQGTVAENESLVIENDDRLLSTYVVQLTVPLLAICAGLFVVDIIIRKLKWEDIRSFFGFGKKQAEKKGVKKS